MENRNNKLVQIFHKPPKDSLVSVDLTWKVKNKMCEFYKIMLHVHMKNKSSEYYITVLNPVASSTKILRTFTCLVIISEMTGYFTTK